MEFIKEWTFTVCSTLMVAVILSVLSPKGTMGKYFKVIIAMFILASFLYPVHNFDLKTDLPYFDEIAVNDNLSSVYEKSISSKIELALEENGYKNSRVDCTAYLKEDEININSLSIAIDKQYSIDEVKNFVFDSLGFNAEVYYFGN